MSKRSYSFKDVQSQKEKFFENFLHEFDMWFMQNQGKVAQQNLSPEQIEQALTSNALENFVEEA